MRVFLDANVLFAAAISVEGRSAALFLLAEHGACELVTSSYALTEARRNVETRYPKARKRLESLIRRVTIAPEASSSRVAWVQRQQERVPEEDAPILAAAIDAGVDVFVTGDRKHFGHLFGRTVEGVRVLSLARTFALVVDSEVGDAG